MKAISLHQPCADCICLVCERSIRVARLKQIADLAASLQRTENYGSYPEFTIGELGIIESALRTQAATP